MEKLDFQEACIEACRLIEQQTGIKIPLVKNTLINDGEWGLFIKRPTFGVGILSSHIIYVDDNGGLYTSLGMPPRSGFQTYDDSDVEAIKREALDQIQEVKERVNRKETDLFLEQQKAIDGQ